MQSNRGRNRILVLATAAALLLGACSGSGSSGNNGDGGSTLTVVSPGVVSSVDPERYQGFISIDVLPNVSGTLVRFKEPAKNAEVLQSPDELEPELAESWESNEDNTEVTFTLREAQSPFGNSITSDDVKWTVDRMLNSEGVPIAKILMDMGGWDLENPITVTDESTFTLNVAKPNAVSLSILSTFFMTIIDSVEAKKHATDDDPFAYDWLNSNTASFGPYTVDQFDPGKEIRFIANENYFRGESDVKKVVVREVPDASSRLQLAESGEVSAATGLTFDQLSSAKDKGNVTLERVLFPNIDTLVPNINSEPFQDPKVRKALAYAVDREAIVASAYEGFATPSADFFHDDFGAKPAAEPLTRDLDKARQLLTEAGYPDGFPMEIAYNTANLGGHSEQVAVLLRAQLKEVGIEVKLNNIASGADFDEGKRSGKLSAWLATTTPMVPDPAYYLSVFYKTGGLTNQQNFSSPELDKKLVQILETSPGAERDSLVESANNLMIDEMPAVPLVDAQKFYVFNNSVTGFLSRSQGNIEYADLQIGE